MATASFKQNIPYFKEQFSVALGNSSIVVKCLCILVVIGYFMSFSETALSWFAVIPGNVLPPSFWYWTFITYSTIELHIWNVLVDILIIVLYGKLLEPLWGAKEMLIFYVVVTLVVAVSCTFFYLFAFLVLRSPEYLFSTKICGLAGYVGAFSVAVKQTMPDHVLINSPFGKLRNKHIPVWMFFSAVVARLLGIVDQPFPVMFGFGIVTSWIYLRFYQKHSNGNKGDMADNFSFASFFPDVLQPVIGVLSNTVFSFLVKIKVCKKPQRSYDMRQPTTITVTLPGTDPQDAERRRKKALQALNDRLSKVQRQPLDNPWPSLEPDDNESSAVTSSSAEPPSSTEDSNSPPSPPPSTQSSLNPTS